MIKITITVEGATAAGKSKAIREMVTALQEGFDVSVEHRVDGRELEVALVTAKMRGK